MIGITIDKSKDGTIEGHVSKNALTQETEFVFKSMKQ